MTESEAEGRRMAHEMRNALGAVRTAAELLQRRVPDEPRTRRLLEVLLKEADRLDALITDAFPPTAGS